MVSERYKKQSEAGVGDTTMLQASGVVRERWFWEAVVYTEHRSRRWKIIWSSSSKSVRKEKGSKLIKIYERQERARDERQIDGYIAEGKLMVWLLRFFIVVFEARGGNAMRRKHVLA
jgi:hypothetical protein